MQQRRGFTILELLLVCAIIMILMGLTLGAVMRYKDVQQKLNSQLTLQKVDSMLHEHWSAVVTAARDEQIPQTIINMAGGTGFLAQKRARVIYIKFRLTQEFPVSYQEVTSPQTGLPVKVSYANAVQGAPTSAQGTMGHKFNIESAACLYLALQQSRNGTNTNVDTVLTSREVKTATSGSNSIKYIVDDWGSPIVLFRWPYNNTDPDLNPPTNANQNNDLQDPEGLLSGGGWPGQALFNKICHPTSPSKRLDPTVASAGRDGYFGVDKVDGSPYGSLSPPQWMQTTSNQHTFDNLYSYRLRKTGRGD
jgi:Tfp pilus assembly protein PilE